MFHRSQRITLAALMFFVPLAAGAASSHKPHAPAKTHKKAARPAAKKPKAGVKTASRPSGPSSMAHRPPAPPTYSRNHFEIPQAKSLADTPDVVMNSRVRAALMAALSVPNQEEITPTTTKGVVTLTGSVKSKALRARAEQAARKVHGVRAVKNELVVK